MPFPALPALPAPVCPASGGHLQTARQVYGMAGARVLAARPVLALSTGVY
jgi:hypothetical protein